LCVVDTDTAARWCLGERVPEQLPPPAAQICNEMACFDLEPRYQKIGMGH
jgi:hypothetical protein